MKVITLKGNERIVAVVPEYVNGAGFRNWPVWVHIVDYSQNTWREECIQPEEQTKEIGLIFPVLEAAHKALLSQIKTVKEKA
jgi:hypothetical protein